MTTNHYRSYNQWKQITLVSISFLLMTLTILQIVYRYKLSTLQKKLTTCVVPEDEHGSHKEPLETIIKEIDKQELKQILEALVEVLPPHVKIESLAWNNQNELTLTCQTQQDNAIATMLEACAQNAILKNLHLKTSNQKDGILIFMLNRPK